jgi:hypothetical protein
MSVCQTSPRLGFDVVLSFHFFKKGETLRGDMITDGQVVGFGLKAQHFETNLPSFGTGKLRKFFKDFGKAQTNTLEGFIALASSEGRRGDQRSGRGPVGILATDLRGLTRMEEDGARLR